MTYEIVGSNPSPYSRKLRAILRYRRLPHVWRMRRPNMGPEIERVRPQLVPMLRFPGESHYRVDSTPLAYALEERHPGQRSILPPDPADAFVCHLIEDFADEWCTKLMYHYRWVEEPTSRYAARWIISEWAPDAPPALRAKLEQQIYDRQRGRRALVGGGEANAPVIEDTFLELLRILAPLCSGQRYLFGTRPSLADFALYGQLCPMIADPLPQRLIRAHAPGLEFWVMALDDAAGVEGDWQPDAPEAVTARKALLGLIGRCYLPFLAANAAALAEDRESFEIEVGDKPYKQAPFGYQGKCYAEIRRRWAELRADARASLEPLLTETGCLGYI